MWWPLVLFRRVSYLLDITVMLLFDDSRPAIFNAYLPLIILDRLTLRLPSQTTIYCGLVLGE